MKLLSFDYIFKPFAIDDGDYFIGVRKLTTFPESIDFEIYKGNAQGYYELYDDGLLDTPTPIDDVEEALNEVRLYYSNTTEELSR